MSEYEAEADRVLELRARRRFRSKEHDVSSDTEDIGTTRAQLVLTLIQIQRLEINPLLSLVHVICFYR